MDNTRNSGAFPWPLIDTVAKCSELNRKYSGKKVIALFATGIPLQNVDVLWRLRAELVKNNLPVVFFYNESAKEMLWKIIYEECNESERNAALDNIEGYDDIYQFDDLELLPLLDFVKVAVTNDYYIRYPHTKAIKGKIVSMPHHAGVAPPTMWSYDFDYVVSNIPMFSSFDYSYFPNKMKIHSNNNLTILNAGHPKLDLILEEINKIEKIDPENSKILLIYPHVIGPTMVVHHILDEDYYNNWKNIIDFFLARHPDGKVVFRPTKTDINEPIPKQLKENYRGDPRFILDTHSDNKYWIARADYFMTDCSDGYLNWCVTRKKPAIFIRTVGKGMPVYESICGYNVKEITELDEILNEIERDKFTLRAKLLKYCLYFYPMLGKSFSLLAEMLAKIYNDREDENWPRLNKGYTPTNNSKSLLRLFSRICSTDQLYNYYLFDVWMPQVEEVVELKDKRIYLYLLKRGLLFNSKLDTLAFGYGANLIYYLEQALQNLPMAWVIGTIASCYKNDSDAVKIAFLAMITYIGRTPLQMRRTLMLISIFVDNMDEALTNFSALIANIKRTYDDRVLSVLIKRLPEFLRSAPGQERTQMAVKIVEECQHAKSKKMVEKK